MKVKSPLSRLLGALILAAASAANAGTIATATTNNGNTLRLMDQRGNCEPGWTVFVLVEKTTSRAVTGCWRLDGDQVIAVYSDGGTFFYDLGHFRMVEQNEPKQNRSGNARGQSL